MWDAIGYVAFAAIAVIVAIVAVRVKFDLNDYLRDRAASRKSCPAQVRRFMFQTTSCCPRLTVTSISPASLSRMTCSTTLLSSCSLSSRRILVESPPIDSAASKIRLHRSMSRFMIRLSEVLRRIQVGISKGRETFPMGLLPAWPIARRIFATFSRSLLPRRLARESLSSSA